MILNSWPSLPKPVDPSTIGALVSLHLRVYHKLGYEYNLVREHNSHFVVKFLNTISHLHLSCTVCVFLSLPCLIKF